MTEKLKGICQFTVIEDVSKKGNPYNRLKLKFSDEYEKDYACVVSDEMLAMLKIIAKQKANN